MRTCCGNVSVIYAIFNGASDVYRPVKTYYASDVLCTFYIALVMTMNDRA